MLSSVTPYPASTSTWPSAVAPPWLPIAGRTNGSPPRSRTASPAARRIRAMLATPRLPAVIPTRIPGLIPATRARTWARVSPAMSSSTGASKRCRTRTIRGSGASQRRSAT